MAKGLDGLVFGQRPRETSNTFASGNNQNSGNILCDVPSTRVARPPGGDSSISFGWDDRPVQSRGSGGRKTSPSSGARHQGNFAAGIPARTSSNSFAQGSNQNCGNMMTDVSSTRVNRPPGGASSMTLGWGESGPASTAAPSRRTAPPMKSGGYMGASPEGLSPPPSPQARRTAARAPLAAANGYKSGPREGYSPPSSPVAARARRPQPLATAGASGDGPSPPTSPGGSGSQTSAPRSPHEAYGNYGAPLPSSSQKVGLPPEAPASPQSIRNWAGVDTMRPEALRQVPPSQLTQSPQSRYREEAFGARPRVTGNAYASGANQNCGNVMTGVPSTRVNRPPGGASSLSFSWDAEDKQVTSMNTSPRARRGSGGFASSQQNGQLGARQSQQRPEAAFGARPRDSSNTFATGSNQNCGNMISDTPTTRVMRPPGGSSSFSLGWD